MKELMILLILAVITFSSSSPPSLKELNTTLEKLGQSIKKDTLVKADEEARKFSDWWEYVHLQYKKSDQNKVDKYIDELDMSLAVGNQSQAKEEWEHLHKQWKKMNKGKRVSK